jgi:hypothetical protein
MMMIRLPQRSYKKCNGLGDGKPGGRDVDEWVSLR